MKWGICQPLIGGMLIAGKEIFGSDPEFIVSYNNVKENEESIFLNYPHLKERYYTNDCLRNINKQHDLTRFNNHIDVVLGVPLCSALSRLNAKASSEYESVDNIYDIANWVLSNISPKVYMFENAPALYTKFGSNTYNNLIDIANKHGYSTSIIYTDTKLHGIPQRRQRTFFFFWKSKNAPILNFYNRPFINLKEYLNQIPNDSLYNNFEFIKNNSQLSFLIQKYGDNFRKHFKEKNTNVLSVYKFFNCFKALSKTDIFVDNSDFQLYKEYCENINDVKELKQINKVLTKRAAGGNIWDTSLLISHDYSNACQNRCISASLHPKHNRLINTREWMHLMGLPHDFILAYPDKVDMISQNVPVNTAKDWCQEIIKFLNNELELSNCNHIKQHNVKQLIEGDFYESIPIA